LIARIVSISTSSCIAGAWPGSR